MSEIIDPRIAPLDAEGLTPAPRLAGLLQPHRILLTGIAMALIIAAAYGLRWAWLP